MSKVHRAGTPRSPAHRSRAVGQSEVPDGRLGPVEDLGVQPGRLGRRRVGEISTLSNSMRDPCVLAGGARHRDGSSWCGRRSDGAGRPRRRSRRGPAGERHLGGGDGPQVVALEVVRLFLETWGGDRSRPWCRCAPASVADLLVQVALRSSASWHSALTSAAPAPRYMTNIDPDSLTARSTSRMPSCSPISQWDALVIGVAVGVEALGADHDVVVLAEAVGRVGRREVRDAQQLLAQLGGHLVPRRRRAPSRRRGCGSAPAVRRPRPGASRGTACRLRWTACGSRRSPSRHPVRLRSSASRRTTSSTAPGSSPRRASPARALRRGRCGTGARRASPHGSGARLTPPNPLVPLARVPPWLTPSR